MVLIAGIIVEQMPVLLAVLFALSAIAQDNAVGSRACADCHPAIFRTYMATGMARSSGRTGAGSFVEKLPGGADRRCELGRRLPYHAGK